VAAEKRGRAKISSPQPPSFLPARTSKFCVRVFAKKSSDFVQGVEQKEKPIRVFSFCEMARPERNLGLKQLIDLIYGLLLEKREIEKTLKKIAPDPIISLCLKQ